MLQELRMTPRLTLLQLLVRGPTRWKICHSQVRFSHGFATKRLHKTIISFRLKSDKLQSLKAEHLTDKNDDLTIQMLVQEETLLLEVVRQNRIICPSQCMLTRHRTTPRWLSCPRRIASPRQATVHCPSCEFVLRRNTRRHW